ncbi:MAG: response regulator [Candidatus Scalindua sp.]
MKGIYRKEKNILIVEGDPDHALLIIDDLLQDGISKNQLVLKSNGQEAIDYIQKTVSPEKYPPLSFGRGLDQKDEDDSEGIHSQIVLIVLDLNLPVVNGMDVLGFIKRSPAYCSIPVIIVSTSHDTEIISEAYKNGANGFITKSYHYDEESFENTRLLREYCKLALSDDFSTCRGN